MHHEMSLMTLAVVILDVVAAILAIFVGCELGQRISNAFDEIVHEFDEFNWYQFPNEINRLLPMILADTQIPGNLKYFVVLNVVVLF